MKLIQLNAESGFKGFRLLHFLRDQEADILTLQEVMSSPESKSIFFDLLENAQKITGLAEVFFSASRDFQLNDKNIYYGNAILSALPITKRYDEFVSLEYQARWDAALHDDNIRLFQHAVIKAENGTKFHLINYHGFCQPNARKDGTAETEKHCARIAEYVSQLNGPVIVAGDFNLAPDSESLAPLNNMLRNLCIENDIQTTRNFYAFVMDTVDYIWVSHEVIVNRFEVLPDVVSDHAPLLLDFDIKTA